MEELRLSELVREVVEAVAPQELELLPQVTAAWLAGDLEPAPRGPGGGQPVRWRGGSIGAGLESALVTLVAYPVLAATIAHVVAPAAERGWQRLWHLVRRRWRRTDQVIPREFIDNAEAARDAILTNAPTIGVSRHDAELLADATYAALIRRQIGDRT